MSLASQSAVKLLSQSMPSVIDGQYRALSVWSLMARKYRLFVNGSEEPLPPIMPTIPDSVLEEAMKVMPNMVPLDSRTYFKECYQQRKSHDKLIEHNKRIRKLDTKIKGGRYDNYDYANRW